MMLICTLPSSSVAPVRPAVPFRCCMTQLAFWSLLQGSDAPRVLVADCSSSQVVKNDDIENDVGTLLEDVVDKMKQ